MIDFHTHILHDIDDGARNLDDALAMAQAAVDDGITTMVATPHSQLSAHGNRYSVELVRERLAELRQALAHARLPLAVLPGTEIRYHPDLPAQLEAGAVLPCGEHGALLIECPGSHLPDDLDDVIFKLQVAGYRIVLAHPERIKPVQKNPNLLIPLIERGVAMQLTAATLMGSHGPTMKRLGETMLMHGMVHLLASDTHGMPPRRGRPPELAIARRRAAELVDAQTATALVCDTPAALLRGKELNFPPPQPVGLGQRWFWWLPGVS